MKYLISLQILILCISIHVNAQNNFYLKPFAGGGISQIYFTSESPGLNVAFNNNPSVYFGCNVGKELNNFRLETGINFLTTGSRYIYNGSYTTTYLHTLIPLSIAYSVNIGQNFSIIPKVSVAPSIYIFNRYAYAPGSYRVSTAKDPLVKRVNLFCEVGFGLQYKVNDKVAISLNPAYTNTLLSTANKNLLHTAIGEPLPKFSIHHRVLTTTLGISIKL